MCSKKKNQLSTKLPHTFQNTPPTATMVKVTASQSTSGDKSAKTAPEDDLKIIWDEGTIGEDGIYLQDPKNSSGKAITAYVKRMALAYQKGDEAGKELFYSFCHHFYGWNEEIFGRGDPVTIEKLRKALYYKGIYSPSDKQPVKGHLVKLLNEDWSGWPPEEDSKMVWNEGTIGENGFYLEDPKNSSGKAITAYINKVCLVYQNGNESGEELFYSFCNDFGGWNEDVFGRGDPAVVVKLRKTLDDRGVIAHFYRKSVKKYMARLLNSDWKDIVGRYYVENYAMTLGTRLRDTD